MQDDAAMRLYVVRGYWRRTKATGPTLRLNEIVVAEDDADATAQALAAWRAVWPSLDGEPVVSSATASDVVGGYTVRVEHAG